MGLTLDEIIKYENETTYVDFKKQEYRPGQYVEFLKDVLAFANADYNGSRYIIIGVDFSEGERKIIGIEGQLTDSAIFQKLLHDKVEPDIDLSYYPYNFGEKKLGIIEIKNCADQPYMMKADYGDGKRNLFKGNSWIRKGSHKIELQRSDLNRIYTNKFEVVNFENLIDIFFRDSNELTCNIKSKNLPLPSERAKQSIEEAIRWKEAEKASNIRNTGSLRDIMADTWNNKYNDMSLADLRIEALLIDHKLKRQDNYYKNEVNAIKLNFTINNNGSSYLEDVSAIVKIPINKGIIVLQQKQSDPDSLMSLPLISRDNYPSVKKSNTEYIISQNIGVIKHQIPRTAFFDDLRLIISDEVKDLIVKIEFSLYSRNLTTPIIKELTIRVVNSQESDML